LLAILSVSLINVLATLPNFKANPPGPQFEFRSFSGSFFKTKDLVSLSFMLRFVVLFIFVSIFSVILSKFTILLIHLTLETQRAVVSPLLL